MAYKEVLATLLGAALHACRDRRTGAYNRQAAVQLLADNTSIKGKGPARVINQVLGRHQDAPVTDAELEALVTHYKTKRDKVAGQHE